MNATYPLIRAATICPVCDGEKPVGRDTCASCPAPMPFGSLHVRQRLEQREAQLREASGQ